MGPRTPRHRRDTGRRSFLAGARDRLRSCRRRRGREYCRLRDLGMTSLPWRRPRGRVPRQGERTSVVERRIDSFRFPTARFDCVVAFDVLEHLKDDESAMREAFRVLGPGGSAPRAVPADMALWSAHDEAVGHVRRYDRAGRSASREVLALTWWRFARGTSCCWPIVRLQRRVAKGSQLERLAPAGQQCVAAHRRRRAPVALASRPKRGQPAHAPSGHEQLRLCRGQQQGAWLFE